MVAVIVKIPLSGIVMLPEMEEMEVQMELGSGGSTVKEVPVG